MSMGAKNLSKSTDSGLTEYTASVNSVGIIHYRMNYLTLGSIITIARSYLDRVYVITNGHDDKILEVANSLGVEVFNSGKMDHASILNKIVSRDNPRVVVTLYGDGTHDPIKIPSMIENVEAGYDITIGSSKIDYNSRSNDIILFLNNKKPKLAHKGFVALSRSYYENLNMESLKVRDDIDITDHIIVQSKNSNIKVKSFVFEDQNYELFRMYRIGVVVPAYNEELLIGETIQGIPQYVSRIYLIDDCSTDNMPEVIKKLSDPRVVYVRHEVNKGVGAAIVTGYKMALDDDMDMVAVMAGDNQMDPDQLPRLLIPIIDGKADYTKGNRLISKEFRTGMSKWRSFGNFILTMITKIASGYWSVTDPQNGYTVISKQALEALDLDAVYTYYGYCNDLLVKLNAFGMRTLDVAMPSRYGREKSKIKYSKYIRKVSPMLFKGFLWRLKTKYILLDFNPLVLFYAVSMVMVPFGLLFCLYILVEKVLSNPISPNFPLLAVFITLMGLQFLMFAMLFDMQADKSRSI